MEPVGRPEAIVRPAEAERMFEVDRIAPSPTLAEFVSYFWLVRWRVPQPRQQQVVPQPRVHIAAENGRLFVHGVSREPFFRTLTGTGHVLGAAFQPGGFRAVLKRNVNTVSGLVRPAQELFGPDDRAFAERILASADGARIVPMFEDYLLNLAPEPDSVGRQVTALVLEVEHDSDIVRAEQLAAHAGLSLRSLQRLFANYVGIGPKWVIQRSRILDATAAAHSGEPQDWAELADRLGFSDQAHLTRVFAQVVGTPPAAYHRDPGTSPSAQL